MKILPLTLLLLVLIFTSSQATSNKSIPFSPSTFLSPSPEVKKIKDTGRPRPEEINSRLYCRACQLMTAEVLKKIGESRSEVDVKIPIEKNL